jgi:hypothetical protein
MESRSGSDASIAFHSAIIVSYPTPSITSTEFWGGETTKRLLRRGMQGEEVKKQICKRAAWIEDRNKALRVFRGKRRPGFQGGLIICLCIGGNDLI